MSLIAPITQASPPQQIPNPVLIGTHQAYNGKIYYLVGIALNINDSDQTHNGKNNKILYFNELDKLRGFPLAGGNLPVDPHNGPQHIFGTSRNSAGRKYGFLVVIDSKHGGNVTIDIAALSKQTTAVQQKLPPSGYAYDAGSFFSPQDTFAPLNSLIFQDKNIIGIIENGEQHIVDLGIIDSISVEIGRVPMKTDNWISQRDDNAIHFFHRQLPSQRNIQSDNIPNKSHITFLDHQPFATIPILDVAHIFSNREGAALAERLLPDHLASGRISSITSRSNSLYRDISH